MATTFRGNQLPAAARHILLERARELIAAGSPKKPAFWGALQVVDIVVHIIPHDEDAPCRVFGFTTSVYAYSLPHRLIAFRLVAYCLRYTAD